TRADEHVQNRVMSGVARPLVPGRGVGGRHPLQKADVVGAVPGLVELELVVEGLLFDIWQEQHAPAMQRLSVGAVHDGRGQMAVVRFVIVSRQADLLETSLPSVSCVVYLLETGERQAG